MKPISPKQHGVAEFGVVGAMVLTKRALDPGTGAARLFNLSTATALALSSLTRYEFGLLKVVPMRAHIAADVVKSATFVAAPLFLRDERSSVKTALLGFGLGGLAIALLTDTGEEDGLPAPEVMDAAGVAVVA